MRAHLYNNFISLGFSYCRQENCYNEVDSDHYSGFLLFSYPNGTDNKLNISEYLFNNNDIKINNIIIDLKKDARIENNIFGYIYYGINIKENGCSNIKILSYKNNSLVNIDKPIEEEKIKIQFINDIYNAINCKIKYT